jgi:glycosyltransferase involved in cell wall biosynthesis
MGLQYNLQILSLISSFPFTPVFGKMPALSLAFIDIATAYNALTPYAQALGGTQAAVCYLGAELTKIGVRVTLINQNRDAGEKLGVQSLPPEALDNDATLKNFSHLILNGRWTEKLVRSLKARTSAPLIGYMHESCFQDPYILPCAEFSGFVFVSDWQKNLNAPRLPPQAKSAVIPNGMAPAFQALTRKKQEKNFTAIYAGSSKRGLLFLPEIIPLLHQAHPDLRFEIYNDGVIGLDEKENENFRAKLKALPAVTHIGAVDQNMLAERLARASFLLSPNTYPETFCIVLAEALRAGLFCIATERAALPGTVGGFAALMKVEGKDDPNWLPHGLNAQAFAAFAAQEITRWMEKTEAEKERHLAAQMAFAQANYDWKKHAKNWQAFLSGL